MIEIKRGAIIIVGALALVLTGVTFAYGFVNRTAAVTIGGVDASFASVIANGSVQPVMEVFGSFKGAIGPGDLFYIEPAASFPGDMVATVSLANADKLIKCYRVMALRIEARDSSGTPVDINADTYKDDRDYALLTLNNGAVDLYLPGADSYTIKLKGGYYVSHICTSGWSSGETSPVIYCDISQG